MITLIYNKDGKIVLQTRQPNQTQKDEGIEVENIPEPEEKEGKRAELYYTEADGLFYQYRDRPLTDKEFRDQFKTPDQIYKELDLSTATLQQVKDAKMAQLDYLCSQEIMQGFDYTIDSTSYRFSLSIKAQQNFTGTQNRFDKGKITQIEWTVLNNSNGNIERITLDQATFESITDVVFDTIDTNVQRLRNTLQPQVESATTVEEVESVEW